MQDAAFIIWLRNQEHVQGKLGDSAKDVVTQERWISEYLKREGDYYFIAETMGGIPVGTYGIYDLKGTAAEPGRWVVHPEVPAGIPIVILAFNCAFERLGLTQLHGSTVATNQNVLSLNRKLGFKQTGVETAAQIIGGKPVDLVRYTLSSDDWKQVRVSLIPLARMAESQIRTWDFKQKQARDATRATTT